ncbi:endonuclease MutS2 [Niallia nealsonii]|uniref:DNA mismatch repair protein n=1 Tax=Niallia nealsonii TaxID=115979 RepID=A0A2N0Z396_9BACI|nr:DNA mismatch repair protein [Niallia nealsonii]PKG23987.1 DNA mismatch repair protein [Niallia nealsonii]
MNKQTIEVLGYETILGDIANFAKTNLGKKTIKAMRPMQEKKRIEQSLKEIAEGIKILKKSSSVPIHTLDEMLLYVKQGKKGIYIRADQFMFVISFLEHCTKLKQFMKDKQYAAPTVSMYAESIPDVRMLVEEISRCIRHGRVDDYASSDLAYLRRQLSILTNKQKDKANQLVKSKCYSSFLQDTLVSERNGHLTLSVKKEYRSKIQGTILDTSASGATVFLEPTELSAIQEEIDRMKMAEESETERILYELTEKFLEHEYTINIAIEVMHHYDVLFAKAEYSRKIDAAIPVITEDFTMDLTEARHPMLGSKAVPLSIDFGEEYRVLVITGPNTGGKTVTLKTIGLLSLMAQSGLPIPAKAGSKIAIFKHIFVDIGDGQSIEQNLSTFSSRIVNIIDILREANDCSLVLLDEIGSGTDPGEGMALAIVILEQLYKKGATLFATTHYSEMKEFADQTDGFLNGTMEFDLKTLKPTYKLLLGQSGQSQAFAIASKLGLHPSLIEKAHMLTYKTHQSYSMGQNLRHPAFEKQVAVNKYAHLFKQKKQKFAHVQIFEQGDNVILTETNETGIIYKGPDAQGEYIVQIRDEKRGVNHKRLKLYIKASELYPADYDFDIIFQSKEYRKISNQQKRKYVEESWVEREE